MKPDNLDRLVREIRACTLCAPYLEPRPIIHVSKTARLCIASQAPGLKVHKTGISFNDPSGDRLRDWISTPKANGYESLHTTVMAKNGQWVEVQIRTLRMDEIAEKGYAAHWKYKDQSVAGHESNLEKWLIRVLLHPRDGFLCHAILDVLPRLTGISVEVLELPGGNETPRRSRPRPVRDIHVEAVLQCRVRFRPEMPFSKGAGGVTCGLQ